MVHLSRIMFISKVLFVIAVVASALVPVTLLRAQEAQADARDYARQAVKAYKEKDYAAYLENMRRAAQLRPDHPTYAYNLAGAYALAGNKQDALATLKRVADMGMNYPAERDADFDSVKETEEFKAILKQFEANKAPVGKSSTAFSIREKGLITESVAYDPAEGNFYVSSVRGRKILKVTPDGKTENFATEREGLWAAMGIKVDARRRHLWVATAAVPQIINFRKEEEGVSGVFKFDLKTGRLVKKYLLENSPKRHWLGDLVIGAGGDVFVTDSLTPALYVIRQGADRLEPLVEGTPFVSPQGLDFSADGHKLFIADYSKGIFVYDLKSGSVSPLAAPANSTLIGIDGLYFHRGSLVAIQNGTRPHRVIRLFLSRDRTKAERLEVIEANNPLFDEPTLGVLVRDSFYYIANSQWESVDRQGKLAPEDKLRDPVILKTKL